MYVCVCVYTHTVFGACTLITRLHSARDLHSIRTHIHINQLSVIPQPNNSDGTFRGRRSAVLHRLEISVQEWGGEVIVIAHVPVGAVLAARVWALGAGNHFE